jgi:two-component system, LytTR family, response regulator
MKKLNAILVDDEESARDVLQNLLLRFCPQVELVAKCENVPEAVEAIKKHQPDLVFLDIEMPKYAGYEIVNFFDEVNFEIIFVTAYDNYAIRAFEISAIDYLLKPIDIERLQQAIARVEKQRDILQQAERLSVFKNAFETKSINNLVVSDKGQQYILPLERIIAIEAQESYCILHTTDKQYIASKNLKHFETVLETIPRFFRVHKSWIINKDHLLNYSKSELTLSLSNGLITKLSKYKKAEFEEAILS